MTEGFLAQAMEVEPKFSHLPARHEVQHAWCDHGKARAIFADWPETALEDGLRQMAVWARGLHERQPSAPADLEVTRRLPKIWQPTDD